MARVQRIQEQLDRLVDRFPHYLEAFDANPAFQTYQMKAHRDAIRRRRNLGSVANALDHADFLQEIRDVLIAWDMGKRGSILVDPSQFVAALRQAAPVLTALEIEAIDDTTLSDTTVNQLADLVDTLAIVQNKARIVPVTKALHHLLPDLVPPMDRTYTGWFFGLHNSEIQRYTRQCFTKMFLQLRSVAIRVPLATYEFDDRWRTSRTKLLDNALIAYCQIENPPKPN
jgi:hypothetical protein